jgi:hypothetical protein
MGIQDIFMLKLVYLSLRLAHSTVVGFPLYTEEMIFFVGIPRS